MAYVAMKTAVVYVTEEVTEGTPVAPSAGNQAVSILSDGFELQGEKELVERNNLTSSLVKSIPRVGIKTATGTIGVECKASLTAGSEPEAGLLFEAALGGFRQVTSTITIPAGSTTNTIALPGTQSLQAGDIVMVKDSNLDYFVTPLTQVTSGTKSTLTVTGSVGAIVLTALYAGTAGDSITFEMTAGATAGSEVVTVVGNDISIQIETGVSTAAQIKAALDADLDVQALLMPVTISSAGAMETFTEDNLAGGVNPVATTLLTAAQAPASNSVIEKFTQYYAANSGHPSLTVTAFMEDAIKMQASGVRVNSLSLDSFETGQIASFSFGLTGQNYTETLAASGLTASFDGATPPLILEACVYRDGVEIPVQNVALSVENTLAPVQSTCSANGIIAQRITETVISGSITPYMDSTSVALFSAFDANTEFSLFFRCQNHVTGGKKEVVAFYIPTCICTALPKQDADGLMQYSLEFTAGPSATGVGSPLYISFI